MSFRSSKSRVESQYCSPKMDKATKDFTNSLGVSPNPPDTSNEASCWDCSPGRSLLLPDSCNQAPKKYSSFRQKTFYADVLTPGASNISRVSAKSNSFSTTVLLKWKDLWCTWYGEIQLLTQVLALHFGQRPLCKTLRLTK